MKYNDLPKTIKDWLEDHEGYGLRFERMMDDIFDGYPDEDNLPFLYDWINAAYQLGYQQGQEDGCCGSKFD